MNSRQVSIVRVEPELFENCEITKLFGERMGLPALANQCSEHHRHTLSHSPIRLTAQ